MLWSQQDFSRSSIKATYPQRYNRSVARFTLIPCKVSSREVQLIDSAVTFAKRHSNYKIDGPQHLAILMALESRTPIAQFRGTLEMSCREAEVLIVALKGYSEMFRSAKHRSLLQELQDLTVRLANAMEGRRTQAYPRQPRIKPKTPEPYW